MKRRLLPILMGKVGKRSFADTFTRGDGVVGNGWVGATWGISTNKVINTPTLGAEALTDGGVENWSDANHLVSWIEYGDGGNTINQESVDVVEGSYSARIDYNAGASNGYISNALGAPSARKFHHTTYSEKVPTGKKSKFVCPSAGSDDTGMSFTGTGAWANRIRTIVVPNVSPSIRFLKAATPTDGSLYYFDKASALILSTAELFATRPIYPTADYLLEVSCAAMETGTMWGIVFALDNPANPQNYVIAYCNGQSIYVQKVVSGGDLVYVGSKAQNFSANDRIKIAKRGTSIKVYLNDVAIAPTYTISDATIVNNLYAGILSTYSGNQIDNWSETVKTIGGSGSFLAPFL